MRRLATEIAILVFVAGLALPALAKKQNAAAVALFRKAIALSDIEAKGSPAYCLQATVRVFGANNQYSDGLVVKFWTPGGKWREETILQGYQLFEISDGRHLWTKNNVNYMPYDVHELWAALAFARRLRWWLDGGAKPLPVGGVMEVAFPAEQGGVRLGKPRTDRQHGGECVKIRGMGEIIGGSCFDPTTGRIMRLIDADGINYEYSDFGAIGRKSFPRAVRVFEGPQKELLEIHIDSIDPLTKVPPGTFLPTPGSQEGPAPESCLHVRPSKLVKLGKPEFPKNKTGVRGVIVLYGSLGTDGVLRGIVALRAPSPTLAAAMAGQFGRSRFRPAVCDTGGVAEPVAVTTDFRAILILRRRY